MPLFQYSGRDNSGSLVSGSLDAASAEEVAALLSGENVTPIEIKEASRVAKVSPRSGKYKPGLDENSSVIDRINYFLGANKVQVDDLIMFARQMHSLTKAGLPLDRAIRGLEMSLTNKAFKAILSDVVTGLENGQTLATSLGKYPAVFSNLFLSLVHVGENTGRLDLAFREVGKYLELEKNTTKQVKSATRYPLFVIVAIAVALAVVTVFVIPVFEDAFERLGADLPWQTVLLMDASNFVRTYWPIILLVLFSSFFGFLSWKNTESGRYQWDRRKLSFPLAGIIFERVALGRFSRTFGMVLSAGVPVVQGLTVVAGAVGNAFISSNIHKMREGVERGESLHRTAKSSAMFSPLVLQMIAVGEETGTVDELLSEVADFYDAEVEYDLKRLGDAIEPILIAFIAGLVLILALGVFLPIWDLSTAANG
ncbi:MAG: type II secretion system F family protein [Proteobacteria bacterium]|nr:type II secretion system F family protein [Pseudomonadota bacterium]MDA0926508.1 type II secretion system F family protein [Pseudomonadota bacterium]